MDRLTAHAHASLIRSRAELVAGASRSTRSLAEHAIHADNRQLAALQGLLRPGAAGRRPSRPRPDVALERQRRVVADAFAVDRAEPQRAITMAYLMLYGDGWTQRWRIADENEMAVREEVERVGTDATGRLPVVDPGSDAGATLVVAWAKVAAAVVLDGSAEQRDDSAGRYP